MTRRRQRPLPSWASEDLDPLQGVANLFDLALVLIVGLLAALIASTGMPQLLDPSRDVVAVVDPGTPQMELIERKGKKVTRYKISKDQASGEGTRLGTAYKLENGEVIYVPEQ
jgi:hypothetical protein